MRLSRQRASLTLLWVASFSLAMLAYLYLRWLVWIGPDASAQLFDSIIGQYLPLLGAILGFYFAGRNSTHAEKKGRAVPYYLAMALSVLWNLITVGFVMRACLDPDKTQDAVNGLGTLAPKLSFFVAGAMGFFFGKSPEAQK